MANWFEELISVTVEIFKWIWGKIVTYVVDHLIPWVSDNMSVEVGEYLTNFMGWLDEEIEAHVPTIRKGIHWIAEKLLKLFSQYILRKDNSVNLKTTQLVDVGMGRFRKTIFDEELEFDKLPQEIQDKLQSNRTSKTQVNEKKLVIRKTKERVEEEGLPIAM
jgi:hypothetical protein